MNHISVCCRERPGENSGLILNSGLVGVSGMEFDLDQVFGSNISQQDIYETIAEPLVKDAFLGFNCTLFSYGQTGSGKTYTMLGCQSDIGIIPRVSRQIFVSILKLPEATNCEVTLSILEIYQEKLRDLLKNEDEKNGRSLRIREQLDGGVWVEGLTESSISSSSQFMEVLDSTLKKRVTGTHSMNAQSSRSHLCCIIGLTVSNTISKKRVFSKIHLVDLAGSEMVRKTDASGVRLEEAKHINKSLSALGNVICALSTAADHSSNNNNLSASTVKTHIPYRDSKLTRLLQDSLGGNSKTVLILGISGDKQHLQETVATLRFGERARQVSTKPHVNSVISDDELRAALRNANKQITALTDTISELQAEVKRLKALDGNSNSSNSDKLPRQGSCSPMSMDMESDGYCLKCRQELISSTSDSDDCNSGSMIMSKSVSLPKIASLKSTQKPKPRPVAPAISSQSKRPPKPRYSNQPVQSTTATIAMTKFDNSHEIDDCDKDKDDDAINSGNNSAQNITEAEEKDDFELTGRCAVCGLTDEDADQLRKDTGETLGAMFTCDGNCGSQFHVRCAGICGDGGQYALPDGEWFCSTCQCQAVGLETSGYGSLSSSWNCDNFAALSEDNSRKSDATAMTLAKIKAEYHVMRRERNRLLMQWQHEKQITTAQYKTRQLDDMKRDMELIGANEEVTTLREAVKKLEAENERVRLLSEDIMKILAGHEQNTAQHLQDTASNPLDNQVDTNRPCKKEFSESKASAKTEKEIRLLCSSPASTAVDMINKDCASKIMLTQLHKPNDQQQKTAAGSKSMVEECKQQNLISTQERPREDHPSFPNKIQSEFDVTTIPKPWLTKKQVKSAGTTTALNAHSTTENSYSGNNNRENVSTDKISTTNSFPIQNTRSHSTPSESKFLNRLQCLIRSVEEETGSFAQIRQKHQDDMTRKQQLHDVR